MVAITHDRYFLDNVAGWILELDRGAGIPYEGNYSGWLEAKSERLAQSPSSSRPTKKPWKEELEWVRKGAKARQAKSKARLQRFEEMQSQEFQKRAETNEIYIPAGPRLGDKVIEFKNVTKGYGDRVLIDDLSFSMPKGAIVGVIGGNGAGKSTLFRMIMGKGNPGFGQHRGRRYRAAGLRGSEPRRPDGSKTVWEAVSDGLDMIKIGNYEVPSRGYVGRFNFKGGDQQKFVKDLSGGERGRLHGADPQAGCQRAAARRTVQRPRRGNPALAGRGTAGLPGAAIVISHDRWFPIGSPLISSPTRTMAAWCSSRATTPSTRPIARSASAMPRPSPTASSTRNWRSKSACTQERSQSAPFLRQKHDNRLIAKRLMPDNCRPL